MLKSLQMAGVGPVPNLSATFGNRLNILTGDNGLGKSFLLDVCFWSLTGIWPGDRIALPEVGGKRAVPTITYDIQGKTRKENIPPKEATFNFKSQTWSRPSGRPFKPGLVVYAAIDGGFAVWDPARNYRRDPVSGAGQVEEQPRAYQFTTETLANGLFDGNRSLCNGFIRDWLEWYLAPSDKSEKRSFEYLEAVVDSLSHPDEPMKCGEPRKVFTTDIRRFPTINMPYGSVPYPQWSAGVRRIIHLAYLMVWAWTEHVQAAQLRNERPTDRLVLIVDEIEAHLHPKWQRTILPPILKIADLLKKGVSTQIFATTHSPLVLASLEPHFNQKSDKIFHFDLDGNSVRLKNPPWAMQGDIIAWLTSDFFGLEQARSREAEEVIEAAEAFLRRDEKKMREGLTTEDAITARLNQVLPGIDPFWPRWIVGKNKCNTSNR